MTISAVLILLAAAIAIGLSIAALVIVLRHTPLEIGQRLLDLDKELKAGLKLAPRVEQVENTLRQLLSNPATTERYDLRVRLVKDAINFAEERAASHDKRVNAAHPPTKYTWQDKRDIAIEYVKAQGKLHGVDFAVEELARQIEAELGAIRTASAVVELSAHRK